MSEIETLEEIVQIRDNADLLVDQTTIEQAISELASLVNRDYADSNPLLLLALKGGCHLGCLSFQSGNILLNSNLRLQFRMLNT